MKTTNDVRSTFLKYFERQGHLILPSAPLVPQNDPTLMFTIAGMVPFKNIFTGAEKPPSPPRATTSQKCVRAGGKHNDLDNVGYTPRHHTFFEMLGNFSFGDYFKEKAIYYAWELLTKEYAISPEKLTITVHPTDDEARRLWKKIAGLTDSRIIDIADNIWMMGPTGPCGYQSEIFYDHGDKVPGGPPGSPDEDGNRFVEIWNLVFMQYEQVDEKTRINLPKPSIDTGSGLERVAAVMQGVHDNYEIDLFRSLIQASEELTNTKAQGEQKASHRVIADHLRSSCFLIADGVLPSNEGRGYVLRRIMRRAMRHAHMLGAKEPLMYRLVPALIHEMGQAFPELKRAEALMSETLKSEEERFQETLDRGLKLLEDERGKLSKGGKLKGDVAFKLYDTYGFPLDLTQDILRGHGQSVDQAGFDASMEEQRARARAAWKGSGDAAISHIWFDLREKLGATEFVGYMATQCSGAVLAIVKDGKTVDAANAGDKVQVLVNQTPFYGESGGQVGDTGWIKKGSQISADVTDTTKPLPDLHVHHLTLKAPLKVGENIELVVDAQRRDRIRANHSATHLLHAALRHHLGSHVTQKGSLVDDKRLRFDISQPKAITPEEQRAIEAEVNHYIWQNGEVKTRLMKPEDAIAAGAMALFGEKYGEEVRVLTMGTNEEGTPYSVELCGGTHVARTGDIGLLKIISESAIAAGVRRIEAVTRDGAFAYLSAQEQMVRNLAGEMKISPEQLPERIAALQEERKSLQKELAEAKKKLALGGNGGGAAEAAPEMIGNIAYVARHFPDLDPKELRGVAESLLKSHPKTVAAVASSMEGKASIVVALTENLTDQLDAAALVKIAAEVVGGKGGGGRKNMAQTGGPDGGKTDDALKAIRAAL